MGGRNDEYLKEREKLLEIFRDVEPSKAKLVEGLIDEAAFLRIQNKALRELMVETGMVKIHPTFKDMQKPTESARQYLKNVNSYAVVIKTLNNVLQKNTPEGEDEFDMWLREKREE